MSKVRILVLASFAAFALSAIAAGSAQAGWLVLGSLLVGSTAVSPSTITDKEGVLSWSTLTIKCPKLEVDGGVISEPDKFLATSLLFLECRATPAECELTKPEVHTLPIEGLVTLEGALAAVATVKPDTSGKIFATFEFKPEKKCAAEGKQAVTGTATILAPTGQDERLWQLISALITTPGELKVGEAEAKIEGSALFHLTSDMPWSFT